MSNLMMCVEWAAGKRRITKWCLQYGVNHTVIDTWTGTLNEQKTQKRFDLYKWWAHTHYSLCFEFSFCYNICVINNNFKSILYTEYIIMWHKYKQISFITCQPSINHLENSKLGRLSGVTYLPLSPSEGTRYRCKTPLIICSECPGPSLMDSTLPAPGA